MLYTSTCYKINLNAFDNHENGQQVPITPLTKHSQVINKRLVPGKIIFFFTIVKVVGLAFPVLIRTEEKVLMPELTAVHTPTFVIISVLLTPTS